MANAVNIVFSQTMFSQQLEQEDQDNCTGKLNYGKGDYENLRKS